MRRRFPVVVLVVTLVLVGCSGPPQTSGQNGPSPNEDPAEEEPSPVTKYETFDASEYVARPPEEAIRITHQVPERLLRSRADEGIKRTVQGFRVQVFSARDKQAAQEFRRKVDKWWQRNEEEAPVSAIGKSPPIVVMYSQPYYRVRIGAFAERDVAERALAFVKQEYSNAFIARSTVTVIQ